jgi:hypothetical protein
VSKIVNNFGIVFFATMSLFSVRAGARHSEKSIILML